jgi:hypothetical protein
MCILNHVSTLQRALTALLDPKHHLTLQKQEKESSALAPPILRIYIPIKEEQDAQI